ncbi:type II toxin-antitoxin system RelE/ParE family toxin [Candidatus Kaiserbacteria bacterium]|nr:MAG: type II toxin-antitoxin system RelE/ParE family toxin [Candidatus Kaiserbacteria bacterium]
MTIIYSDDALRQLKKLSPALSKRIVLKIADNVLQDDPLVRAKALQGTLSGKYRYRIGDYRAIFTIDENGNITILTILSIKHRKDVYK